MIQGWFPKISNKGGLIGFSPSKAGVALAQALPQPGSKHQLTFCDFLPGEASGSQKLLSQGCRHRGINSCHAVCVLEMDRYQLLQVTPPEVPPEELREAIRWQIGDLIDYPPEEAVVDLFHIPRGNQGEKAKTVYVVVARQELVAEQAALMRGAKLKIRAVDIPELVLCNLVNQLPETGRGVGCLYFDEDAGLIILSNGQELCLARNLPFGTHKLTGEASQLEPIVDAIALEIQRSFDFYERNFAQVSVGSLVVAPQEFDIEPFLSSLHDSLGIDVATLDLGQILECPDPLPAHAGRCLLAIGAALREDEVAK
jgi:MSHA biogenesis protein MshI